MLLKILNCMIAALTLLACVVYCYTAEPFYCMPSLCLTTADY
jgi:hypothetical protein